jgi:hypothetical protein
VGLYFIQVKEGNKLSCLKQKSPRFRTLHQRRTMPLTGQHFVLQGYTHMLSGLCVVWVEVILFGALCGQWKCKLRVRYGKKEGVKKETKEGNKKV